VVPGFEPHDLVPTGYVSGVRIRIPQSEIRNAFHPLLPQGVLTCYTAERSAFAFILISKREAMPLISFVLLPASGKISSEHLLIAGRANSLGGNPA